MNYTYMLRCADGSLYTGWTSDLAARLHSHQEGKGGRYPRSHLPVSLIYCEGHEDRAAAMRREVQIKRMSRKEKLDLLY